MAICVWISTSSNDFNVTGNWSTGSVPTTGDTIIFNGTGTAAVTTNLNQSSVVFGPIYIDQANTAQIGTLSAAGVAAYFQHASANVYIGGQTGQGSPAGSQLILLDSGSTSCTYAIYDSAASSAVNVYLPPIQIKGSALTIDATGGTVAVAARASETATTASLSIAKGAGKTVNTPSVYLGQGVTVTALTMDFGSLISRVTSTVTAAIVNGGTYTYTGTGAHTALTIGSSGTVYYSGTGTITTLSNAGQFDRTQDARSVTITNTTLFKGAKFNLDNGKAGSTVRTNPPSLSGCSMQDVTFTSPVGDLI
jgi:hypothetical protein